MSVANFDLVVRQIGVIESYLVQDDSKRRQPHSLVIDEFDVGAIRVQAQIYRPMSRNSSWMLFVTVGRASISDGNHRSI